MAVIIRLQNLPLSAKASDIRTFFQGLKIPDGGVNIIGGENGDAFIAFSTDDDARKAMLLNNQPINFVDVRLFLSSKQEMLGVLTEAKNKILKRTNPDMIENSPSPQPTSYTQSINYTLFNPMSKSLNDSLYTEVKSKIRVIDHSNKNSNVYNSSFSNDNVLLDDPPRPNEFSYKSWKKINQMDYLINNNDLSNESIHEYKSSDDKSTFNVFLNKLQNQESNDYSRDDTFYNEDFNHFANELEESDNCYSSRKIRVRAEKSNFCKSLLPEYITNKNYAGPQINRFHDYSERPSWLEERKSVNQHCVIRVTLPFPLISENTILEMFEHLSMISKKDIKIELDMELRETGYVYILFKNRIESEKALKLNGKHFCGATIIVEKMIDVDIFQVCDNPEMCFMQTDIPFQLRSPYFKDLCIEIINVSSEINEKDVKDFLNINIEDKRIHFIELDCPCCLISVTDELMMCKILSFDRSVFRFNSIRVLAISKYQYETYLHKSISKVNQKSIKQNISLFETRKNLNEFNTTNFSCAKLENLLFGTTATELLQFFPSATVEKTHILVNATEAIVDFQSPITCQKVLSDLKLRSGIHFVMKPISSYEFQSLKTLFLKYHTNGFKSTLNISNKLPFNIMKTVPKYQEKTRVKIKNLVPTITTSQLKQFLRKFENKPVSVQLCPTTSGRHLGEAILLFLDAMEAVGFKDECHGKLFMQRELEVLLSDRN